MSPQQLRRVQEAYGKGTPDEGKRTHLLANTKDPDMIELVRAGFFHPAENVSTLIKGWGMFHLTLKGKLEAQHGISGKVAS
jgi:hypothetical protein